MRVYDPNTTVRLETNNFDYPSNVYTRFDGDLCTLKVTQENWALEFKDVPMTYDATTQRYYYDHAFSWPDTFIGEATGLVKTVPTTIPIFSIRLWRFYVSVQEIRNAKFGYDLTDYSDEYLQALEESAREMINNYTQRKFGWWQRVEKWETIVDRQGRFYVKTFQLPIEVITNLEVWITWSAHIKLFIRYAEVQMDQGYLYYSVWGHYGIYGQQYPIIVLWHQEQVFYQIDYESKGLIPPIVKTATNMIIGNMVKSDFYLKQTNMAGVTSTPSSFKSWEYSVNFSNQPTSNTMSAADRRGMGYGDFMTPTIAQMLNIYKRVGQNMI